MSEKTVKLQTDTERLDWLERAGRSLESETGWIVKISETGRAIMLTRWPLSFGYPTARAAIDAAMEEEAKP